MCANGLTSTDGPITPPSAPYSWQQNCPRDLADCLAFSLSADATRISRMALPAPSDLRRQTRQGGAPLSVRPRVGTVESRDGRPCVLK
jgi:hypothetical protein